MRQRPASSSISDSAFSRGDGMTAVLRLRRGGLGARPLWSPYLFGTALRGWFNSREPATVTQAAGLVSAWASLVNGWAVSQPVGASQPTYTSAHASWMNRDVLAFSDGARNLVADPPPLAIFRNRGGGSLIASLQFTSLPGADCAPVYVSIGGVTATRASFGCGTASNIWQIRGRRLDGDSLSTRISASAPTVNAVNLMVGSFDWSAASAYMHVNGGQVIAPGAFQTAGLVSDIAEGRVAVGGIVQPWTGGRISNVLLVNRILTTNERQQWEGFEAHSLGLASTLLPADHPFRFAPPRATLEEVEAFGDTFGEIDFTLASERERMRRTYLRPRGLVKGWRAAA